MRFCPEGPAIPDLLFERSEADEVVFLCGAGVSRNSNMPDFRELTDHVIKGLKISESSEIVKAFPADTVDGATSNVAFDEIFDQLYRKYDKNQIDDLITKD